MPQVPDIPGVVPQIQPFERPVPLPGVEAPPAAFGESVANAVRTFGGDVEKASTEVFNRALALRQLQVEGKLRDLTTDYYNEVAPIQNDFLTQQRNNASSEAMSAHLAQIDAVRQKYAALAEQYGPYGRNTFGADTASLNRGFTVEATRHSARETQKALDDSVDSNFQSQVDLVRSSQSDAEFTRGIDSIPKYISDKAAQNGWGPQQAARQAALAKSQLIVARVESLARVGKTQEARGLYDQLNDQIVGEDNRAKAELVLNNSENNYLAKDAAKPVSMGFAPYMRGPDIQRFQGVADPLQEVFKKAQRDNPDLKFTIGDHGGVRTTAEQAALVAAGRSRTMQSGHLNGTAFDVVALGPDGRPNYKDVDGTQAAQDAIRKAAVELNVPLDSEIGWDKYHVQLAKGYDVASAPKFPQPSLQQQRDSIRNYLSNLSPNNPLLPDHGAQRVDIEWEAKKRSDAEARYTGLDTIDTSMGKVNPNTGKLPTTIDELSEINPLARQAYESLRGPDQLVVDRALAGNARIEVPLTAERKARFEQMVGMSQDPDHQSEFLNTFIGGLDLTGPQKDRLNTIRGQLLRRSEQDPRVPSAMADLQQSFGRAIPSKAQSPLKYQQFTGALRLWMEDYIAQNKKPPKPEEVRDAGRIMIKDISSGLSGLISTTLEYQQATPKDFRDYMHNRYPGMPDEEIHNIWVEQDTMEQFKKLHEQKKPTPAATTAEVATPEVPISR